MMKLNLEMIKKENKNFLEEVSLENRLLLISEMNINYIKYNLKNENSFRICTNNGIVELESAELINLILETHSTDDIRALVANIRKIKKRNMPIRHFFQTIATGLI